jgi:hypothetical protein
VAAAAWLTVVLQTVPDPHTATLVPVVTSKISVQNGDGPMFWLVVAVSVDEAPTGTVAWLAASVRLTPCQTTPVSPETACSPAGG